MRITKHFHGSCTTFVVTNKQKHSRKKRLRCQPYFGLTILDIDVVKRSELAELRIGYVLQD